MVFTRRNVVIAEGVDDLGDREVTALDQFTRDGGVTDRPDDLVDLLGVGSLHHRSATRRLDEEVNRHADGDQRESDEGKARGGVAILDWDHGPPLPGSAVRVTGRHGREAKATGQKARLLSADARLAGVPAGHG